MTDFDSIVVQALVERARRPLDGGEVRGEIADALAEPGLSSRDRGQLLLADVVASQGRVPAEEAAVRIEQALALLKQGGDEDTLASAIAMSAAVHASTGDMQMCVERCLDFASLTRADQPVTFSTRSVINFGVALLALGAYELASELFVEGVNRSRDESDPTPLMVSALNLSLSISREVLVHPASNVATQTQAVSLDLIDSAVSDLETMGVAAETQEFIGALRAHLAQLRGDLDGAVHAWGSLDSLVTDQTSTFARYFCLVEAPIALHQGHLRRAMTLVNRSLAPSTGRDLVPLRHVEALRLRSVIHERLGDAAAALVDARQATEHALRHTSRLPDVLIGQVNQRVLLEHSQRALLDQRMELTEQAMVDELSQVGNRRAYEQAIDKVRVGPQGSVSAIICDIDDFKAINDRYGHGVGDQVVARSGEILAGATRSDDQVFRYGGDEFVVLAPAETLADALGLADRVYEAVRVAPWLDLGLAEPVTFSIGVWAGESGLVEDVVAEADGQLYEAKRAGRNCIRPLPYSQCHD